MRRTSLRLLVALLCALLLVTSTNGVAEARKKKGGGTKVVGVSRVDQDWAGARLKVKWRAVKGATYQMRAASSSAKLGSAALIATKTAGGTFTGPVSRAGTTYVQVRAIRSGKAGAWSKPGRLRFQNSWPATQPVTTGASGPGVGQVTFSWTPSANTSDYLLETDGAPYGSWPGPRVFAGSWLPSTQLSQTYSVPTTPTAGDRLLAVPYGNPVFARVEAHNRYHSSGKAFRVGKNWALAWPTPPTPAAGDKVRIGTYNVGQASGQKLEAVASNIVDHGLDAVAMQELPQDQVAPLLSLLSRRDPSWAATSAPQQQVIVYNARRLTLTRSGTYQAPNPKAPGSPLTNPWAELRSATGQGRPFVLTSVHVTTDPGGSVSQQNAGGGRVARSVAGSVDAVRGSLPAIVAGDLQRSRVPLGDASAAQPTFVGELGYYDTVAALQRAGTAYNTVNARAAQAPDKSGVGFRADHVLVKGFQGANSYENVATTGGTPPSDHNLVLTEVQIPN